LRGGGGGRRRRRREEKGGYLQLFVKTRIIEIVFDNQHKQTAQ